MFQNQSVKNASTNYIQLLTGVRIGCMLSRDRSKNKSLYKFEKNHNKKTSG